MLPGQLQWSQASLKRATCASLSSMMPSWRHTGAHQVCKVPQACRWLRLELINCICDEFSCLYLNMYILYMLAHQWTSQERHFWKWV